MRDRVYVARLLEDDAGRWVELAGRRAGPFADDPAVERYLLELLARWRDRARERGGWAWRRTRHELVVTLPDEVVVSGGEPLTPMVVPRGSPKVHPASTPVPSRRANLSVEAG